MTAENEEMIRKGLVHTTDWLSMDCVVVAEATDGRDECEKILEHRPDVVITDICMPLMDGIEIIKKVSEQTRFESILLTSYADSKYARRTIEARVCEYLLKPVDEKALADTMERLGEEIVNSCQVKHVIKQAETERGNLNLEYYMQLDSSESQYISGAIKAIREDLTRRLSIESISDDLGIGASYLSRKFKEVTGQIFLDFLNKYRVQQAIVILGTGQYRTSGILGATRLTDYKHLCSMFKEYTSKSPTKFIKGAS